MTAQATIRQALELACNVLNSTDTDTPSWDKEGVLGDLSAALSLLERGEVWWKVTYQTTQSCCGKKNPPQSYLEREREILNEYEEDNAERVLVIPDPEEPHDSP